MDKTPERRPGQGAEVLELPVEPAVAADPSPRIRRTFWALLWVTLAVKLALAAAIPILGDEAYFILWGRNPALGYYDHPPLVGWILAGLLTLSDELVWLRLPSVLLSTLMALGAVALLRRPGYADDRDGADRAYLVGIVFLLLPIHLVGVFTLTDTPLVLFAFASGGALIRASEDDDLRWYAASGVALGLAFLAKYLAVLLGLGYLVWWLGSGGGAGSSSAAGAGGLLAPRRRTAGFAVLLAAAAPFVLFNLAWNATHCWTNVLFNLYSRHAGEGANYSVARNLLFYAATHLYMATPVALWFLVRRRRRLREALAEPPFRVAATAFGVPMSVLLLFALTSVFGAYWVLPFYPFFFLLLQPVLARRDLVRTAVFLAVFAGLQVVVVGGLALAPPEAWRDAGFYRSMVTMERTGELVERLEARVKPNGPGDGVDVHWAATGYSLASILSFERAETVTVLGTGTHYARQDDFLTDFRSWDGDRVLVVSKRPVAPADLRPWFAAVRTEEIPLHGVTFHAVVGEGFDYGAYREEVLTEVRRRYYRVPGWLPEWGCPFDEKYFQARRARK